MSVKLQIRRGLAAEWAAKNPILAQGEIGIELDGLGTEEIKQKIGNGVLAWNSLPYQASGKVKSVNGLEGDVVLNTANVSETVNKKYATDDEKAVLANTSGTNTGDQDISKLDDLSGVNTGDQDLSNLQVVLSDGAFVDGDKIKLDELSGTNTGDQDISGIDTNADAIALNTVKRSYPTSDENKLAAISGTNTGDQDISGITTNATAIALNTAKVGITTTQSSEIAANTLKVGITPTQASEISDNTDKRSYPLADENKLSAISGTNTGDQNISGIATNATDIAANVTDIATNATDIATNVTAIDTNATDIATNVTAIDTNATDITERVEIATNPTKTIKGAMKASYDSATNTFKATLDGTDIL